jgi:hypothetical protein
MSLQTDIAMSHLETLIENLTGANKAAPDSEGDYSLHIKGATFWARIDGDDQPICRVYAIISDQVTKVPELLDVLNTINSRLIFLRVLWVNGQILMEGNCLALTMDVEDFNSLCQNIASAVDTFGDRLVGEFGGVPCFKESKDSSYLSVREGNGPLYL